MSAASTQLFSIATGSSEPIYRQLVDQTRRLIAGGQLAPGDAMPSVRDIAAALAVNPMTVSKAYGILEMEGVLTRRRGLGMEVAQAKAHASSVEERIELLRPTLARAVLEAQQLELDADTVLAFFATLLNTNR